MKCIAVCGTFDEHGGRPSGYMRRLFRATNVDIWNGGPLTHLESVFKRLYYYDVVFWFPNVANNVGKYLPQIKAANPNCILVSSKNNTDKKYSHKDLISRMLSTKSNLLLEVISGEWTICSTIHDPLGNVFVENSDDIETVRNILISRVKRLYSFARKPTKSIGAAIDVPDNVVFFDHIKRYADKFHSLIHASNQDRLLGNASFRCERGFPSFKSNGYIYVSCRNIDKRHIQRENFVAVVPLKMGPPSSMSYIEYFGEVKPSVDTPIQAGLYWYYKDINYMLHSHTYVDGAPFTKHIISCGAIEEYDEILDVYPETETSNVAINLKGHGSLVMASDLQMFDDIQYIARPAPEYCNEGEP